MEASVHHAASDKFAVFPAQRAFRPAVLHVTFREHALPSHERFAREQVRQFSGGHRLFETRHEIRGGVLRFAQYHLVHADYRVHRRAYLVGHTRQEIAFRTARRLRVRKSLLQYFALLLGFKVHIGNVTLDDDNH